MVRISLDPQPTLGYRLGSRISRRRYGVRIDPVAAMGHNMQVGRSYAIFELQVERAPAASGPAGQEATRSHGD